MKRFRIFHQTLYTYSAPVELKNHTLRLRPREGHELRIERSNLDILPVPQLRWQRDAEDNSVATAVFASQSDQLTIKSEIIIQQYDQTPYDFVVEDYAGFYPFNYLASDIILLAPYRLSGPVPNNDLLSDWIKQIWTPGETIQTYTLLQRINQRIYQKLAYQMREEAGVQTAEESLTLASGSCRDSAYLFMEVTRRLGFAARFVSGYTYSPPFAGQMGSTHAWAEVFIPGAGWKGFDPSSGSIVGINHIAVAVARLPHMVPPVSGAFIGSATASMAVGVWVSEAQ